MELKRFTDKSRQSRTSLKMMQTTANRMIRSSFTTGIFHSSSILIRKFSNDVIKRNVNIRNARIFCSGDKALNLEIGAHWEHFANIEHKDGAHEVKIQYSHLTPDGKRVENCPDDQIDTIDIHINQKHHADHHFRVLLPKYVNIALEGDNLNLNMHNKMYGDLIVDCHSGQFHVDKVKGHNISLNLGHGDLHVGNTLEGNISIICNNLVGKILNGNHVHVYCNKNANVNAVYGSDVKVEVKRNLSLALMKGKLEARIFSGKAKISGIDGSFEVLSGSGDVDLQINSLTPHSTSEVQALNGSIHCAADPEMKALLSCQSSAEDAKSIQVISDAFTKSSDHVASHVHSLEGMFTGRSQGLKRPSFREGNASSSGKIDIRSFERPAADHHAEPDKSQLPSLHLKAAKNIEVKTTSWIEVIRKKHGLA